MLRKLRRSLNRWALIAPALVLLVAVGCSGDEEAEPTQASTTSEAGSPYTLPSADSARDSALALADCLSRAGVPATVLQDLSMTIDAPDIPSDIQQSAFTDCAEELGPGDVDEELPDDAYPVLYEDSLEQVECLTEQGYPIDWSPTFETFRESWKSGTPMMPYAALANQYPSMPPDELRRLESVCPQYLS